MSNPAEKGWVSGVPRDVILLWEAPLSKLVAIKSWQDENPEKVKAYKKTWRDAHKEERREYNKAYYHANHEKSKEAARSRYKANSQKIIASRNEYQQQKYKTDLNFRIKASLRSRISKIVSGSSKGGSAVRDLGCTVEGLKRHLEAGFVVGMSWENYGLRGWHIDHIIPLCKFDLTDPTQFAKAVHFSNLQPMWWEENLKKGGK